MATLFQTRSRCKLLLTLAIAVIFYALMAQGQQPVPAAVRALPECALGRTNAFCKLVIDRDNPVAPPTVQMYSDQTLTVIVKNPREYERYFLDYQTGQATLSPDVTSSIV